MQPIQRQADQYPDATDFHRVGFGKNVNQEKPPVHNDEVFIMPGEQSGLYGEDEDHPYDAIVKKSPHGNGYDVLHPFG